MTVFSNIEEVSLRKIRTLLKNGKAEQLSPPVIITVYGESLISDLRTGGSSVVNNARERFPKANVFLAGPPETTTHTRHVQVDQEWTMKTYPVVFYRIKK